MTYDVVSALGIAGGARYGKWYVHRHKRSVVISEDGVCRWRSGAWNRMDLLAEELRKRGLPWGSLMEPLVWTPEKPAGE